MKCLSEIFGKHGGRERVSVSWSHRDKLIGERSDPALFQFDREWLLGMGKSRSTLKDCGKWLQLIWANAVRVSIK